MNETRKWILHRISAIILAPLYFDQIVKKNDEFVKQGGTFIKIWPKFEIVKE